MVEPKDILFNDMVYTTRIEEVHVEDVVIVHLAPSDVLSSRIDPVRHIVPAQEAIDTQLYVAKMLGKPYATHREALEDYIAVHWAWCEHKCNAATSLNPHDDDTAILYKDKS